MRGDRNNGEVRRLNNTENSSYLQNSFIKKNPCMKNRFVNCGQIEYTNRGCLPPRTFFCFHCGTSVKYVIKFPEPTIRKCLLTKEVIAAKKVVPNIDTGNAKGVCVCVCICWCVYMCRCIYVYINNPLTIVTDISGNTLSRKGTAKIYFQLPGSTISYEYTGRNKRNFSSDGMTLGCIFLTYSELI